MEKTIKTDQKINFFQKNTGIILCSILCTALWGSAFPCVKLGYELFKIGADDIFSKILFAGGRFFLAGIFVLIITTFLLKKFPTLKKGSLKGIALLGFVETTMEYVFFYIYTAVAESTDSFTCCLKISLFKLVRRPYEPYAASAASGTCLEHNGIAYFIGNGSCFFDRCNSL